MNSQIRQNDGIHRRVDAIPANRSLPGRFLSLFRSLIMGIYILTFQIGANPQQTPDIKFAQQIQKTTEQPKSSHPNDQPEEPAAVPQLWAEFYAARDSAEAARARRDIATVTSALLRSSRIALSLNRKDLAAWQLNNIGYYSIEEFKKQTDYNSRLRAIDKMRRGPQKELYIKETKRIFRDNLFLLTEATKHLEEAYELDKDLNDDDRTQKIYSNLAFIDWVQNFVNRK